LAWFAVRREWRSLSIALGVTAALMLSHSWSTGDYGIVAPRQPGGDRRGSPLDQFDPGPLWIRVPAALALSRGRPQRIGAGRCPSRHARTARALAQRLRDPRALWPIQRERVREPRAPGTPGRGDSARRRSGRRCRQRRPPRVPAGVGGDQQRGNERDLEADPDQGGQQEEDPNIRRTARLTVSAPTTPQTCPRCGKRRSHRCGQDCEADHGGHAGRQRRAGEGPGGSAARLTWSTQSNQSCVPTSGIVPATTPATTTGRERPLSGGSRRSANQAWAA